MAELAKEILRKSEFKPYIWGRYFNDIFFLWKQREGKLKSFVDNITKLHQTIKFTADWSKTSVNALDVTVSIKEGIIEANLYVKPTDSHQYILCHLPVILLLQIGYAI